MLLNYGVGEDSWESLGLQEDPTSQSWILIGRTDAAAKALILWPLDTKSQLIAGKIEGRRRRGQRRMRWLDGITALMDTRANSGRWWKTGKPDVLQFVGSQRVRHDLTTERQQMYCLVVVSFFLFSKPVFRKITLNSLTLWCKWLKTCYLTF